MNKLLYIFLSLLTIPISVISQTYNFEIVHDLNGDGVEEKILFVDEFDKEFQEDQFNKIQIIFGLDTFEFENRNIWIPKNYNQSYVSQNLENRIGLLKNKQSTILWLTGYQYGCCINVTTFIKVKGSNARSVFQKEFEIDSIFYEGDNLYFLGSPFLSEAVYGAYGSKGIVVDKYIPLHVYSLSEEIKYDSAMTYKLNRLYYLIYDEDVFTSDEAYIVHYNFTNDLVLVNKATLELLKSRDFGVLSLTQVNDKYLNQ